MATPSKPWQAEKAYFKQILSEFPLEEVVRWGKPCYQYQGENLFLLAGFKEHCCIMLFNGALLKDPKQRLVRAGENTQSARQFRIHNLDELVRDEAQLRAFIQESIAFAKQGIKIDKSQAPPPMPQVAEWDDYIREHTDVAKAFSQLTPGRQRAYLMFFAGAKQAATRMARIEKWRESILMGKGMND